MESIIYIRRRARSFVKEGRHVVISECVVRLEKEDRCAYLEDKNLHPDVVVLHALHQTEQTGIIAHHGIEASLHEGRGEEEGK